MRVLGVHDGHNSSAALLEDGKVLFAIQEERLRKTKNYDGLPTMSIEAALKFGGVTFDEIDHVAIGSRHLPKPKSREELLSMYAKSSDYRTRFKTLLKHTPAKAIHRKGRLNERMSGMREAGIPEDKLEFVEHHQCHAAAAYWGSHFRNEDVLVFTNDGAGDDLCGSVSHVKKDGSWERLNAVADSESVGHLYALCTYILGMVPLEHEYKLMGMAPYAPPMGKKRAYEALRSIYSSIGEDGSFKRRSGFPHIFNALDEVAELIKFQRFDWIAAGVQQLIEELLSSWIRFWIRETGVKKIAMGGGVFMNVKANQLIYEMDDVEDIFIFPSCGDETNAIGAAYQVYDQTRRAQGQPVDIQPLEGFYLGDAFTADDVENFCSKHQFAEKVEIKEYDDIEAEIAKIIAKGGVVARAKGRMEFGARALGNRSILTNPAHWESVNTINKMVKKRDFWMPFAPSMAAEDSHKYVIKPKPVRAPYMILTFDTKPEMRSSIRAAIHPYDATARPQEVYPEWNADYHRLIKNFESLTGSSVVLNTSFNLHGLPICHTPEDAVHVLDNSGLDHLAVDRFMIKKV